MEKTNKIAPPVKAAFAACRAAFVGLGLFGMVVNLLMLTGPIFMLQIYDRVLSSRSIPTLVTLGILVASLYIFFGLLEYIRSRMLARIAQRLEQQLGDAAFDSTVGMSLQLGRHANLHDPVQDLNQVRQFISGPGPIAIFDIPWMPFYIVIIYLFHPILGMLAMMGAALLILLTALNEVTSRGLIADLAKHQAERSSIVLAGRRNSEVLAAMGMLSNIRKKWRLESNALSHVHCKSADRAAMFSSLTKMSRFLMQSSMLGVGAYYVIQQEITPGVMIAASIIMSRALAPVEQAVAHWRGFIVARQSLKKLNKTLEVFSEETIHTELPTPKHRLKVSALFVAPPGEATLTLKSINFKLSAGDCMGVIGPSASGKSTLARALVGVWAAVRGDVRLDEATLNHWDRDKLGKHIGYLPQDVELFEGSVADNISRFDKARSDEDIILAAGQAGVHDMILQLGEGYDTEIGNSGAVLSAGQRQRIGLARALYLDPFLIVLDEPNSNLDSEGDAALTNATLAARKRGAIVIIIAHRPSAIATANKLLVLDSGSQQAFGPKEEVLRKTTTQNASSSGNSNLKLV